MATFLIILICIVIYAVSAFGMYKYIQIERSDNGKFPTLDTTGFDVIIMFFSLFNTFWLACWITDPPRKSTKIKIPKTYNKFFKIKNT